MKHVDVLRLVNQISFVVLFQYQTNHEEIFEET